MKPKELKEPMAETRPSKHLELTACVDVLYEQRDPTDTGTVILEDILLGLDDKDQAEFLQLARSVNPSINDAAQIQPDELLAICEHEPRAGILLFPQLAYDAAQARRNYSILKRDSIIRTSVDERAPSPIEESPLPHPEVPGNGGEDLTFNTSMMADEFDEMNPYLAELRAPVTAPPLKEGLRGAMLMSGSGGDSKEERLESLGFPKRNSPNTRHSSSFRKKAMFVDQVEEIPHSKEEEEAPPPPPPVEESPIPPRAATKDGKAKQPSSAAPSYISTSRRSTDHYSFSRDSQQHQQQQDDDSEFVSPEELYFRVAEHWHDDDYFERRPWPSRAPYKPGATMGRGAEYFPRFKEFCENGGLGFYKNAVVMNIRLNDLHSLDIRGGSFTVNFFLDVAYWVPEFDEDFFSDPTTMGTFAKYDPVIDFPYFMETRWLRRETEFSKRPGARRHECQLGQTFETVNEARRKPPKAPGDGGAPSPLRNARKTLDPREVRTTTMDKDLQRKSSQQDLIFRSTELSDMAMMRSESLQEAERFRLLGKKGKSFIVGEKGGEWSGSELLQSRGKLARSGKASDAHAHWPRLWRTLVLDEQLAELKKMSSEDKRKFEPGNSRPEAMHSDLREKMEQLDEQREEDLAHPDEGIIFVTFEIEGLCRQLFSLSEFPFDVQTLHLTVRLGKPRDDPLKRYIVPLCHDKAFFCSSRVPPLTEWDVGQSLDWRVERGVHGNEKLDGGRQRLVADVLVLRKSYYYSRHYLVILFLMTTCAFTAFTVDAVDVGTRTEVIFSLLLTIVAFNYSCSDSIPTVSYATIFESFINVNFMMVIAVGGCVFFFSWLSTNLEQYYEAVIETIVGVTLFFLWIFGNAYYWYSILNSRSQFRQFIIHDERIGWLDFKHHRNVNNTKKSLKMRAESHDGSHVIRTLKAGVAYLSEQMSQLRRRTTS